MLFILRSMILRGQTATHTDYAGVTRNLTYSSKGLAVLGPHTEDALRHSANLGLR
jgi:hypothetical protein